MDDALIVNLFDSSPEDAMDALSEKYARLCRRIAGNILTDPRDVEECVNDSLLEIWKRLPADRPEQLTAYVCRIARHIALNRLEYNRAAKRDGGEILPVDELTDTIPDGSLRADGSDRELGLAIGRYLRSQKPDRADIFVRRYFYGCSIREIAARYRFTESKVCSLLSRMRGQLKEYLKKEGYYFDDE